MAFKKQDSESKSSTILDLEFLKFEIGKQFPFYDYRQTPNGIAFYCNIDKSNFNDRFSFLRKNLDNKGYIPLYRHDHGEDVIYIIKKPDQKQKPFWVNIALLVATIITTLLTGSLLELGYGDLQSVPQILDVFQPQNLLAGALFFSLPLISILFIHEMGHYYFSKKHHLQTSFPFFLPVPPILPGFNIGTFGALISSGDPMPDKKTLFDVGISGPIAGFIVAVPVTIIGLVTSEIVPFSNLPAGETILGTSLLFSILSTVFLSIPEGFAIDLNSIAFAGWIGLLITSINLLPAGQLDGGHIFRAVLGDKQKYAGWLAVIIMVFTGWWFFAFIILLLIGVKHPPPLNDESELDFTRKLLFFVAVAILLLCFIPYPITIL
ncbi:MAG TPA: site-2 protease family protein [Candidatus Thermoplasmatota archaeon]|nr:site-2 protease family protein [Candidatus Thermoplasmatota archaeon]